MQPQYEKQIFKKGFHEGNKIIKSSSKYVQLSKIVLEILIGRCGSMINIFSIDLGDHLVNIYSGSKFISEFIPSVPFIAGNVGTYVDRTQFIQSNFTNYHPADRHDTDGKLTGDFRTGKGKYPLGRCGEWIRIIEYIGNAG